MGLFSECYPLYILTLYPYFFIFAGIHTRFSDTTQGKIDCSIEGSLAEF